MSIETPEELEALKAAGRAVAAAIRAMRAHVRPGVSTEELDEVGARVFRRHGARSGPQLEYGFPGVTCISVNDEAVHGVPSRRRLRAGDLIKLDVTAELDGFYADACVSVSVGSSAQSEAMIAAAHRALASGMSAARAGAPVSAIGAAVERSANSDGYSVCPDLMGHGIGRNLHEGPDVPNFYVAELSQPLTEGLVLTIEPIITSGSGQVRTAPDGWTVLTCDGAPAAHAEHTLVITEGQPLVLTAH